MAAQTYLLQLSANAQTLQVTIAGVAYQLTIQWRDGGGCGWVLDIADVNGNPIVQGIPLVTGINLLQQYAYLGIGGELWVTTTGDPAAVPTYENLGSAANLYLVIP